MTSPDLGAEVESKHEGLSKVGLFIACVISGAPLLGMLLLAFAEGALGDDAAIGLGFLGLMIIGLSFIASFIFIPIGMIIGTICWSSDSKKIKQRAAIIIVLQIITMFVIAMIASQVG